MKSLILASLLCTTALVAQTPEKPVISVVGNSTIRVTPDMSLLSIQASSLRMNMSDATKQLGDQTQQYITILKKLGFQESDIKTTSFSVTRNTIYRNGTTIDSGFVARQSVQVRFPYTEVMLQKIVARLSDTRDPVDYSISFYLSDMLEHKTMDGLKAQAIKDARESAHVLSTAAGVKLGGVKVIQYGSTPDVLPRYEMMVATRKNTASYDGLNLSFTPEEVELTEHVTVIWYLE